MKKLETKNWKKNTTSLQSVPNISRFLKVFALVGLLTFSSAQHEEARASGFPVVDIAGLIQSVMEYVQILQDYIVQVETAASSYTSMITQVQEWEQLLVEYELKLKNLSDFAGDVFVNSNGWLELIEDSKTVLEIIGTLDPESAVFEDLMDAILIAEGIMPKDMTEDEFSDLSDPEKDLIGGLNSDYKDEVGEYQEFLTHNAALSQASNERLDQIVEYGTDIEDLGEESELATQQLKARQDNLALLQNENIYNSLRQLKELRIADKMERLALQNKIHENRLRKTNIRRKTLFDL